MESEATRAEMAEMWRVINYSRELRNLYTGTAKLLKRRG
jgi:hypothetical protein